MDENIHTATEYEAPKITEIGSLHEITLQNKFLNAADGVTFGPIPGQGVPIGSV